MSSLNTFTGNAEQQATSVVTNTNQRCYELVENCYSVYGFEVSESDLDLEALSSNFLYCYYSISQVCYNFSETICRPLIGMEMAQATTMRYVCSRSIYFGYYSLSNDQYISWVADGMLSWSLNVAGMAADPTVDISARPVPQEPMVNFLQIVFANVPSHRSLLKVHHRQLGHV